MSYEINALEWQRNCNGQIDEWEESSEAVVMDLLKAGADRVTVLEQGGKDHPNYRDELYIYLPDDLEKAIDVMIEICELHPDAVTRNGFRVRIWWD